MALVTSHTIAGTEVVIHAYPTGRWEVLLEGDAIGSADTMDKAIAAARNKLAKQKVKVHVPFVTLDGKKGFAYAIHAKSRKPMAEIDGTKDEYSPYRGPFKADIPQDVLNAYLATVEVVRAAQKEIRTIEDKWTFGLDRAVKLAVEKATEAKLAEEGS